MTERELKAVEARLAAAPGPFSPGDEEAVRPPEGEEDQDWGAQRGLSVPNWTNFANVYVRMRDNPDPDKDGEALYALLLHSHADLAALLAYVRTLEAIIVGDKVQDSEAVAALVRLGMREAERVVRGIKADADAGMWTRKGILANVADAIAAASAGTVADIEERGRRKGLEEAEKAVKAVMDSAGAGDPVAIGLYVALRTIREAAGREGA